MLKVKENLSMSCDILTVGCIRVSILPEGVPTPGAELRGWASHRARLGPPGCHPGHSSLKRPLSLRTLGLGPTGVGQIISGTHRDPGGNLLTLPTQDPNQNKVAGDWVMPLVPGRGAGDTLGFLSEAPSLPVAVVSIALPACPLPSQGPAVLTLSPQCAFWASCQQCQVSAPVFPVWQPAQLPGDILSLWPKA